MSDDGEEAERHGLQRAFDAVRFHGARTLNLRALQPSAMQASAITEQWLRGKQMEGVEEALVITGRGNRSAETGYSPVREAIVKLLPSLRRRNVLSAFAEHSPGSFVVTFAPIRSLFEAPKRRRERTAPVAQSAPAALLALDGETLRVMRELAILMLASLGVHSPSSLLIEDEMCRQFAQLTMGLPSGPDRAALLQQSAIRALEEFEME